MRYPTWLALAAILVCNPLLLRSQSNGDTWLKSVSAVKSETISVPEPRPEAIKEAEPAKPAGVLDSYDPDMGKRLAAAAKAGNIGEFTGKCYTYVAWHMDAAGVIGFYNWVAMGIEPGYSADADDFAVWAAGNQEKMRREMKLAILPTPEDKDEVPPGSILVYDRKYCGANKDHGHIEILIAPNRACSDGCQRLEQNCFADPAIREHVHVIIPVKE